MLITTIVNQLVPIYINQYIFGLHFEGPWRPIKSKLGSWHQAMVYFYLWRTLWTIIWGLFTTILYSTVLYFTTKLKKKKQQPWVLLYCIVMVIISKFCTIYHAVWYEKTSNQRLNAVFHNDIKMKSVPVRKVPITFDCW